MAVAYSRSELKEFTMKPNLTASLTDNETGKTFELPIIHGSIGPRLVDVRKFYGELRHVHLRSRLHVDRFVRLQDYLHRR